MSLSVAYYFYGRDRKKLQTLASLLPTLDGRGGGNQVIDLVTLTRKVEKLAALNEKKSDSLEKLIISQRDLLHGIAHEVRSPLARMEFAIELLQTAGEQEQAELSLKLDKYLKEIDELVRELLRYSRLQHHESEIRLTKTTIGSVIGAGVDKVIDIYPTIQFSLENKGDVTMHCDNHLMIIAMANILRNAGRFARTTCVINWLEIDNNVVITIEDDGAGLPPGKVQQIFEPFTRLDPSRTRDSGGHGLGLAIVQAIIHRHNGLVEVSDGELGGAKFQLTIPKC
jgi:two-component system OmpR family sensor kinase